MPYTVVHQPQPHLQNPTAELYAYYVGSPITGLETVGDCIAFYVCCESELAARNTHPGGEWVNDTSLLTVNFVGPCAHTLEYGIFGRGVIDENPNNHDLWSLFLKVY